MRRSWAYPVISQSCRNLIASLSSFLFSCLRGITVSQFDDPFSVGTCNSTSRLAFVGSLVLLLNNRFISGLFTLTGAPYTEDEVTTGSLNSRPPTRSTLVTAGMRTSLIACSSGSSNSAISSSSFINWHVFLVFLYKSLHCITLD